MGGDADAVVTGPTYHYEVSREKIREYAAALGEDDPRYFSDGDDCVAPPTFAACFTVVRGAEAVLPDPGEQAPAGLIHGSQSFEYPGRPLRPGDRLACTPRLVDVRERRGAAFLTVEVQCRFADSGRPAVVSSARFVRMAPGDGEAAQ